MSSEDRVLLTFICATVVIIAMLICAFAMTAIVADSTTRDELPRCREDQVLIGFGEFGQGQWDEYTCGYCPETGCEHSW